MRKELLFFRDNLTGNEEKNQSKDTYYRTDTGTNKNDIQ